MSEARRGMGLMATAMVIWAFLEAIAASVMRTYSPFQVVWTRYAVHLAFMLAVWGWRAPSSLWRTERPMFQLVRSSLMLIMPASWVIARRLGVHDAELMSLFWLAPMMICALGGALLRERIEWQHWCAAALLYMGTVVALEPRSVPDWPALLAPIVMGFTFAAYVVMTRSLRSDTTRANLFYTALGVFVLLTPVMPAVWVPPTVEDFAVLTIVGLLGWIGLWVLDRMAGAGPVSVSAPFAFAQIPVLLAMGWVTEGDRPDRRGLVGSLLIALVLGWFWLRGREMQDGANLERAA